MLLTLLEEQNGVFYLIYNFHINWVSKASLTLGCSIKILRDIYLYVAMYVGLSTKIRMPKCVGGITWPKHAHAQSQFCAVTKTR